MLTTEDRVQLVRQKLVQAAAEGYKLSLTHKGAAAANNMELVMQTEVSMKTLEAIILTCQREMAALTTPATE